MCRHFLPFKVRLFICAEVYMVALVVSLSVQSSPAVVFVVSQHQVT